MTLTGSTVRVSVTRRRGSIKHIADLYFNAEIYSGFVCQRRTTRELATQLLCFVCLCNIAIVHDRSNYSNNDDANW